ncbi:MAG: hypothetical protein ACE5HS_04025 [bacterium]
MKILKNQTTVNLKSANKIRKVPAVSVVTWLWLILLITGQTNAQSFSGRFSTSFYTWERVVSDSSSSNHLRLYQTAQITLGQLASNKLSFHLYGLASQDLADSAEDDPIPRLYNAYFRWKDNKGVINQIKLGRQRIASGAGYGIIDGMDLTLRIGKYAKVAGFVGFLVPFTNTVEVDNWDNSHAFGFRASTNQLLGAKILLSFQQRNRRPAAYPAPGRYAPQREQNLVFDSLEQRLLALDVYRYFSKKLSIYGRLDYDLEQERVRRGQFELKILATEKLELSGEFFHRAPLLEANSIFTVFEQNTSQHLGLRVNYRLKPAWFLNGNLGYALYEGDEALRFGVGLRFKYGYIGYNFRSGYGGENNGAYASINYPLNAKLALMVSTGLSRYRLYSETADANTSLTGSFGFNYKPAKNFTFDFLGQGVRNRFFNSDLRFFVKANYWIFKKNNR